MIVDILHLSFYYNIPIDLNNDMIIIIAEYNCLPTFDVL